MVSTITATVQSRPNHLRHWQLLEAQSDLTPKNQQQDEHKRISLINIHNECKRVGKQEAYLFKPKETKRFNVCWLLLFDEKPVQRQKTERK